MKCNEAGVSLIKSFEGCRLDSYKDTRGIWTIGWGATGPDIVEGMVWSQIQADERFLKDLSVFESGVNSLVKVPIGPNQFSALVSFSYNLGLGSLKSSMLLRCVNMLHFQDAAKEFLKWCHNHDGTVNSGLLRRRKDEQSLFSEDPQFS